MIKLVLKSIFLSIFIFNSVYANVINDIVVYGNKRISKETIVVLGEIKLNKLYNDNNLNILTKKLFDTGFFKDITLEIQNEILNITVIENPIIENIEINGIKKNSLKEFLLEKISLKFRSSFSDVSLQNDIILIRNILKSLGYYFAEVKPSLQIDNELNSLKLIFDINQGSRAKIKNISFIGDKKIKNKKLYEIIASEEHKFWKFLSNKIYLDQSRIDLDRRLLENYYKNLGYYDVDINDTFVELDKDGNFNLIYNINAGKYYFFNDLTIELPDYYQSKDFLKIQDKLSNLKGKKYSFDDFNSILLEIENIAKFRLYDFIDAKVEESIVDNNKINFKIKVSDSTNFYVERINILGNYHTIEEVIRNKFIVDEGDPLNKILYNKSIDNIKSLNIFKTVKSEIKDGSNQNFKQIDVIVEEKPTGEISLAAGVGTSGSTIGAGIIEKNFLGKGININTNLEISQSSIKGQFIYSKPNFAYTDNTLFTSIKSTTTDNLKDFGYKISEFGLSVATEYEKYENFFFNPSLRASIEDLETNSSASSALSKQADNYKDLYFDYGISYDMRNSKFRPSSGNQSYFFQELPILSNNNEITNTFIFTQYKELSKISETIGKGSIYLKSVNSINDDVRISKRANVPYNRLRGFERGKIGPIDDGNYVGGNYVSAINLSSNLPFILPTLENFDFSIYVDAANVWGVDYDKSIDDSNKIRSSTGIALDLLTPVGPLSFSLSKPITKNDTDKLETFRFNLGTTF